MTLAALTRFLYRLARTANTVRIADRVLTGHPQSLVKHVRNRMLLRYLGRFLR